MTIVVPLRMRTAPLQISTDANFVLRSLRDLCFPDDYQQRMNYVDDLSLGNPETIHTDDLCERIVSSIRASGLEHGESIFIDVGGPSFDETVPPKIARALADAVDELSIKYQFTQVAMLMQREYMPADRFVRHLEMSCCKYQAMILFADSGMRFNADGNGERSDAFAVKIRDLCALTSESNRENLRLKLIRHRGFYSLPIGTKTTVSVFDGRNCVGEISELLLSRLTEHFGKDHRHINVLVDDENSRWLADAAYNAKMQSGSSITFHFVSERGKSFSDVKLDAVLFSVIRSGNTVKSLLTSSSHAIRDDAFLWSLISSEPRAANLSEPYKKSVSLPSGAKANVLVEMVKNSFDDEHLSSLWAKSSLAPFPVSRIELRDPFRADEMWSLLLESGIKPETEVPSNRSAFKWVPDMEKFVGVHGPLLAGKIAASLSSRSGGERVPQGTYFFVHPREPAAITLVDYICRVTKKRSIGIERGVLDAVQGCTAVVELEKKLGDPDLLKHLAMLKRVAESEKLSTIYMGDDPVKVVIIDEFSGTGDTVDQLRRLANMLGWEVQAVVCPLLMGPRTIKNEFVDHTYYEFGLPI
ncbi:hypothetical protein [Neorhizobium sp. DAR64872/K0K18]|uniref:hypothetical protein n=1 Tax=Neorhizobium sp. DAR64872/K0K18 TaxID=3421958 RepID=UPI003D27C74D